MRRKRNFTQKYLLRPSINCDFRMCVPDTLPLGLVSASGVRVKRGQSWCLMVRCLYLERSVDCSISRRYICGLDAQVTFSISSHLSREEYHEYQDKMKLLIPLLVVLATSEAFFLDKLRNFGKHENTDLKDLARTLGDLILKELHHPGHINDKPEDDHHEGPEPIQYYAAEPVTTPQDEDSVQHFFNIMPL